MSNSDLVPNVLFRAQYYTKDSKEYGFYSSKDSSNDYLEYVNKGVKEGKTKDFLDYTGNPEKSSGAFSKDGILTYQERKEIREELRNTNAQIWSCLLSFEEEFGKKHLKSWRDAKDIIESEFPRFLRENNIKYENIVWFAGLHENTDNRHIHICFFEKEPLRVTSKSKERKYHEGTLKKLSMENLKIRVEQRMSGIEYDIKSSRTAIIGQTDGYLNRVVNPKVEFDKTIKKKLMELYRKTPKGNHGYESKQMDGIRDEIDEITTAFLMRDYRASCEYVNLLKHLSEADKRTKEICQKQRIPFESHLLVQKFKKDLYRRIGNRILRYIRDAKSQESGIHKSMDYEKKKRWDEKKRISFLLTKVAHLDYEVNQDRMAIFDEFEKRMEEMDHQRAREEAERE